MQQYYTDLDVNSLYPVMPMASSEFEFVGADFAFATYNSDSYHVKIFHKDVKKFLFEETGKWWVTIHLKKDDPLLSMLFLKFKGRQET